MQGKALSVVGFPSDELDGSFVIRFVCKEIPHRLRFSPGIESHNPDVPSSWHRVPQLLYPERHCYVKLKLAGGSISVH